VWDEVCVWMGGCMMEFVQLCDCISVGTVGMGVGMIPRGVSVKCE